MAEKDEIVPYEHMVQLHVKAKAARFKDQLLIEDGMHNDSWNKDVRRYFGSIQSFIHKC